MSTTMHRLQISLPQWQVHFLTERARREGVSMAELVRRLVQREAEATPTSGDAESLRELAGVAEDHAPLIEGVPVSERPELYLTANSERRRRP